jgi:hypothetical protein
MKAMPTTAIPTISDAGEPADEAAQREASVASMK